jgi:hypothetical protein
MLTQVELEEAHCWFPSVDVVPGQPQVTEFKQAARLHQARWRRARNYDEGTKPYKPEPGKHPVPVGSRLQYEFAKRERVNLISDGARAAADDRLAHRQPHQTMNEQRLWCDLLSSMPLCFNLFGPLSTDLDLAREVIPAWFPALPGTVTAVHLEWSPGRLLEGRFLENRTAFDAAVELDLGGNKVGILGIETKYHEHAKPEKLPNPQRRDRYMEVAGRHDVFHRDRVQDIPGTTHQQLWQDHLLALSMLGDGWDWARFVVVYPAENASFARAAAEYRTFLRDESTFDDKTLEALLGSEALPERLRAPLVERYLW